MDGPGSRTSARLSSASPLEKMRRCARTVERCLCTIATYLPLVFIYSMTVWATFTILLVGRHPGSLTWMGHWTNAAALYVFFMLNWSYTIAVFTDPGSTTGKHLDGYSLLPSQAPSLPKATSFTVKSNGEFRYCKKCQTRKPDRAHHCSTCRRCVLKMDHHCPWLATCVGLHNHKAFVLFLTYTALLCFLAVAVVGSYVWVEVLSNQSFQPDSFAPINHIVCSVMASLLGIVLGCFAGWHILLAARGQTTIECLEKTRYLSPLRQSLLDQQHLVSTGQNQQSRSSYGQQLIEMHANALPGITRLEEGEDRRNVDSGSSLGTSSAALDPRRPPIHASYHDMERYRSRKRYDEYLDEVDTKKLPNAFDLGWRRNLLHLFGPSPFLWLVPICNTTGNGWAWPANPKWLEARDHLHAERMRQHASEIQAGWGAGHHTPDRVPSHSRGHSMSPSPSARSDRQPSPAARPSDDPGPATRNRTAGQAATAAKPAGWGKRPASVLLTQMGGWHREAADDELTADDELADREDLD